MPDILYERPLASKELMGVGFRGEARRLIVSSVGLSTISVQYLQRDRYGEEELIHHMVPYCYPYQIRK